VRFHRLPPPTDDNIRTLALAIEQRMKRVLDRWRAAGAGAKLESLALLAQCATGANEGRGLAPGEPSAQREVDEREVPGAELVKGACDEEEAGEVAA